MQHLTIASFKYGVDTRRSELTSSPGTLVKCENGHINQGGQIEKRKAFTLVGQLPRIANGKTIDAFGLQEAGNTLYTFGSADPTGVAMPPGVTYRRVRHYVTSLLIGGSPPTLPVTPIVEPAITSVVQSSQFKGSDFVTVTFGQGEIVAPNDMPVSTQSFYAGSPILSEISGEDMGTTAALSGKYFNVQFKQDVDAFLPGYTAVYQGNTVTSGIVFITGPLGIPFTLTPTFSAGGPTIGATLVTNETSPAAAIGATFTFYLVSGTSGSVDHVEAANSAAGGGTQELLTGGSVNYSTSLLVTAQAVAAAINNGTLGYQTIGVNQGYSATASLVNAGSKVAMVTVVCPPSFGTNCNSMAGTIVSSTTLKVSTTPGGVGSTSINPVSAGGVDQIQAAGQVSSVQFNVGTWPAGAWWSMSFTANNLTFNIGRANFAGLNPTFALPLSRKMYLAMGNQFNFSALDNATRWEQQDTGAGFVQVSDLYSSPVGVVSFASYQGRLAVFGRRNIQIWGISADPSQYQQLQSLQNIGTFAPLSVQSLGDLDVLFLSDTGIRSLRVRDSSLNAFSTDIGSAVDDFVIADLQAGGDNTLCCGIVEPTSNRYWLYTKGRIFVLSYFPTLKIQAWSTYLPTYDDGTGNQVTFTPRKFLVFQGQVYCLAEDGKIFLYGGANNNTYDGCVCTAELPWLDNKTPFFMKQSERVNIAMSGRWQIELGMDPRANTETQVVVPYELSQPTSPDEQVDSTFNEGSFPFSQKGTHFKFLAYTDPTWTQIATLSAVTLQYMNAEEA